MTCGCESAAAIRASRTKVVDIHGVEEICGEQQPSHERLEEGANLRGDVQRREQQSGSVPDDADGGKLAGPVTSAIRIHNYSW
jgi:hypothetical protein